MSKEPMQTSESELDSLTADLEERHQETLPKMRQAVTEWREELDEQGLTGKGGGRSVFSRRNFLVGGGTVAGGLLLAACSSSSPSSNGTTTTAKSGGGGSSSSAPLDVQIGAMAASLENLAVSTYQAGLQAAQAGKLGTVPPAVGNFATTAMKQHQDHANAWNAIVAAAGYQKVTGPDPVVKPQIDSAFSKVTDVTGLAKLALNLENVAAATYLSGISAAKSKQAISTAATIQPVEMQHAATLYFVMGTYPVPNAFAQMTGARPPSDYKVKKA